MAITSHQDFRTVGKPDHSPEFFLTQFLQLPSPGRDTQPVLSPAHWEGLKNDSSEGQALPNGLRVLSDLGHASFPASCHFSLSESYFPNDTCVKELVEKLRALLC